MTVQDWIKFAPAVLCGGLAGAVLNHIVASHKGRQQPIDVLFSVAPMLQPAGPSSKKVSVSIDVDGTIVQVDNLYLVNMLLANRGNVDRAGFEFGISLAEGDRLFSIVCEGDNRHRKATVLEGAPSADAASSHVDFRLEPFNRKDTYLLQLLVGIPEGANAPGEIVPSTKEPVVFRDTTTTSLDWLAAPTAVMAAAKLAEIVVDALALKLPSESRRMREARMRPWR